MGRDFHEFPPEEYQVRYERARQLMAQEGLDALLVTDVINYRYFTGHTPRTGNRPAFFILPLEGEPVLLASSDLGTRDALQMSHVSQVIPYDLPFRPAALAGTMERMGLEKSRIGLEIQDAFFGSFRSQLQPGGQRDLEESMSGAGFQDASEIMWKLRSVKTPREIQCIRQACDITALAYEETFARIQPGMTEREVAVLLVRSMVEHGADIASLGKPGPTPAIIMDASRPAEEVHVATGKRLEPGDLLHLDMGVYFNGYCSDFGRSATIGPASPFQRKTWQAMVDKVYQAMEALRPGTPLGEIQCHWHATGMEFVEGPFGGLVNKGINRGILLEPGMVICLEDMVSGPDGETYQFEEVVVGTGTGVELLSHCDPALREIEL